MNRKLVSLFVLALIFPGCAQATDQAFPVSTQSGEQPESLTTSIEDADSAPAGRVDLPRYPSISPGGKNIVFSWRGDLWKVPSTGGHARRLTSNPADEHLSAWSNDGKLIAFDSTRKGGQNVFVMNADGTDVRQITNTDQYCSLSGFGIDESGRKIVTFAAYLEGDNYRSPRPYGCLVEGGDFFRLHDAFGSYPKVSGDGSRIAFTRGTSRWDRRGYRGPDARDVWLFNRSDGSFKQLTSWEGNDGKACWAGNNRICYLSDKQLNCFNVYIMDADKGEKSARRLTSFDEYDIQDLDVSADGSTAVFKSWDKLYTLDLNNPQTEPVVVNMTANEDESDNFELKSIDKTVSEAAISPDGEVMAYVAYGEIYVRSMEEDSPTRRVTKTHARERGVTWSPDGLKLYFHSDLDGTESIYTATVALTRSEVKEDFEKAINPPKEKEPADTEEVKEQAPQEDDSADEVKAEAVTTNGEKKADEEETDEPAEEEKDNDKNGDKKDKKEKEELPKELQSDRWHDALKFNVEPLLQTGFNDRYPNPSPDGKLLAFQRGAGNIMILYLETKEVRELITGWDSGISVVWSPDSRYVAYTQSDMDFNSDIWIMPTDGSKPAVNVTRHPDNDYAPCWSADGKILAFLSERVNDEFDVWMVYLDKDIEALNGKDREKYYEEAVKTSKKRKPLKVEKPKKDDDEEKDKESEDKNVEVQKEKGESTDAGEKDTDKDKPKPDEETGDEDEKENKEKPRELDLEDAYLRVRRITTLSGNEGDLALTPGGDMYIFTATIGDRGLYSVKWDGKDRKRLCGAVSVHGVSLTGDKIVVVSGGRAGTIAPTGKKIEYVDISDKTRIDLKKQASQKFLEMARLLGENFYHPTLKGLDWPALTKKYHELATQTRTAAEFDYVGSRLLGELNGSHLGVYSDAPDLPNIQSQGRLGTIHRRVDQGYLVEDVIPLSPADKGKMALKAGDIITAIDGKVFGKTDTVESLLTGRINKETMVSINRTREDGEVLELTVLITPVSRHKIHNLKYDAWRQHNADLVSELSDGKIGYIHIEGMGQAELDIFERDLYAAAYGKKGLIIDVRNNGGGWTADRLLSSIMVKQHAYTMPRGAEPTDVGHYPQDRLFIQRCTLPINMLCNEKSFSNAEIISHAFKTLKRGTLVGQQTYGGVISTGGTALIDDTFVRLPFRGWFLNDGTDMENNGAIPDVTVIQTPEAESRNEDEQLKTAVKDLLKRL